MAYFIDTFYYESSKMRGGLGPMNRKTAALGLALIVLCATPAHSQEKEKNFINAPYSFSDERNIWVRNLASERALHATDIVQSLGVRFLRRASFPRGLGNRNNALIFHDGMVRRDQFLIPFGEESSLNRFHAFSLSMEVVKFPNHDPWCSYGRAFRHRNEGAAIGIVIDPGTLFRKRK